MSGKKELKPEEKVRIVRRCLEEGISTRRAGREAGVGQATIRRWIARYKAEGVEGFLPYERNRSYSPEFNHQAVRDYLSGKGSLQDICGKYKIRSDKDLRGWVRVYNAHGDFNSVKHSGGGSYMKQGRDTTQEERIQIAKDCIASGKNYGEMAQKYQVSYQQVRTWTIRFEQMGEAGLQDRRGRRKKDQAPRTELEQAQIEIEQLKHMSRVPYCIDNGPMEGFWGKWQHKQSGPT